MSEISHKLLYLFLIMKRGGYPIDEIYNSQISSMTSEQIESELETEEVEDLDSLIKLPLNFSFSMSGSGNRGSWSARGSRTEFNKIKNMQDGMSDPIFEVTKNLEDKKTKHSNSPISKFEDEPLEIPLLDLDLVPGYESSSYGDAGEIYVAENNVINTDNYKHTLDYIDAVYKKYQLGEKEWKNRRSESPNTSNSGGRIIKLYEQPIQGREGIWEGSLGEEVKRMSVYRLSRMSNTESALSCASPGSLSPNHLIRNFLTPKSSILSSFPPDNEQ